MTKSEKLNLFFVSFFFILMLAHFNQIERSNVLLGQYTAVLLAQLLLAKWQIFPQKLQGPLREFIVPILSVLVVFDSLSEIVPAVNPHDIDYLLIRLDYLIFGTYPTVWIERFYNPYFTDLLSVGYCTYYFMPVVLGVALKLRRMDAQFNESLFTVLLCFYLSYVGYLLFPALGPRYTMLHLQQSPLEGAFLFEKINHILNTLERIKRDAFPSGHTGITLVVLYLTWRFQRGLLWLFIPSAVLLVMATVYCRYHYGVDLFGGVVLAILTIMLARALYNGRQSRP